MVESYGVTFGILRLTLQLGRCVQTFQMSRDIPNDSEALASQGLGALKFPSGLTLLRPLCYKLPCAAGRTNLAYLDLSVLDVYKGFLCYDLFVRFYSFCQLFFDI